MSEYTKYRILEIIPGTLSWVTLIAALLLSFIKPLWIIYFIIIYGIYWLLKVLYLSTFLIISYMRMKDVVSRNWLKRCNENKRSADIFHLVILPTFKEGVLVIEESFQRMLKSNYDMKQCIVVFAVEESDKENGLKNAKIIEEKYSKCFKKFLTTVHVLDPKNEIQSKGSNITHAGKEAKKYIDKEDIDYNNIIVSVFDIDTQVHPEYFGYLTYTYIHNPNPTRSSYQPVPVFHNNIWDAPAIVRVASYGTTFWLMGEQVRPEKMLTFSSHSMPFQALVDVGFWSKDIVSEDSRIFLQCLIRYDGNYNMTPLYIPVSMDGVLAETRWQTLKGLYKQQRRWAWGSENIPFMIWNFIKNPKMGMKKKLQYTFNQIEGMHSWATAPILIFTLGRLPLWFADNEVQTSIVAQNAPFILQWLMTLAMVGLILSLILSTSLLPPKPTHHKSIKYIFMIVQWILLPISLILFGSFPALDAQTRLMFGKYLGFNVTQKARKS